VEDEPNVNLGANIPNPARMTIDVRATALKLSDLLVIDCIVPFIPFHIRMGRRFSLFVGD
jgi:hypothetical protein